MYTHRALVFCTSVGSEDVLVSHLQFADDTVLFLEPNANSFLHSLLILSLFEIISGLKINLSSCGLAGIDLN